MHFQPERLTEAREARDLTMTALADLVGRKPASISHYENGRHEPPAEVIESLAESLRVGVGFFFRRPREEGVSPTFFRSMAAATKRARTRAERRIDWAGDVLRFLEEHVEIQPVDLPPPPDSHWGQFTKELIESAASNLRRFWGLGDGPIPNLVWLVEQHGIVVVRDSIGNNHLDAHSRWCGHRPIVVLNSDKKSAVRSRFDLAHELGHLLLHREISTAELRRSENRKEIEKQANLFAGAFMMPAETFVQEVGGASLDGLLSLKPRWKMAVASMIKRCERLGLFSEKDRKRLWRSRSSRGWNKREPFDDTILPERPRMMGKAFEVILANDLASREAVLSATQLRASDVEGLAGLSEGFLSLQTSKVIPLFSVSSES